MAAPFLFFALSRPHAVSEDVWKKFFEAEHFADLIGCGVVRNGALYRRVSNPMGRLPPDEKTFLAMYDTDFDRFLQSDRYKQDAKKTSGLFPNNGSPGDVADVDARNYQLVEIFDPKGLGSRLGPAPFILEAEAEPLELNEFQTFYREDHAPMMAKHPGYRRTLLYQLGALEWEQAEAPNPILIIHEFDHFGGLGGPITQASLETELAKKVFPTVKSMKARTLQLVCSQGF